MFRLKEIEKARYWIAMALRLDEHLMPTEPEESNQRRIRMIAGLESLDAIN
jgi:hypothetical protein